MNSSIKSTSESGSSFQELIMADKLERYWKTAMEIIAKAAEDKVYKVYLAATKAFRTLLTFSLTWDLSLLRNGIRPILNCILIKCADGQKRMAELSLKTIFDLCNGRVWGQSQRWWIDKRFIYLESFFLILLKVQIELVFGQFFKRCQMKHQKRTKYSQLKQIKMILIKTSTCVNLISFEALTKRGIKSLKCIAFT